MKRRLNIGQEFVIGGFTPDSNESMHSWSALRRSIADVRGSGQGRTGSCNSPRIICAAETACCREVPLRKPAGIEEWLTAAKMKECIWVKPKLVANFEFIEWTDTNHVRHIKIVGLRNDKNPRQVVRE